MKHIFRARSAGGAAQVVLTLLPHRLAARNDDVDTAAAPSVELLLVGLAVAVVFVTTAGFVDVD